LFFFVSESAVPKREREERGERERRRGERGRTICAMEASCRAYFATWNTNDGAAVGAHFTEDGTLRDWDISVVGRAQVAEANGKIFAAVPGIKIEVLAVHESPSTRTATCEILVKLPSGDLKVADVIEFAPDSLLIKALRAYKG
jgi:hypothetical protein